MLYLDSPLASLAVGGVLSSSEPPLLSREYFRDSRRVVIQIRQSWRVSLPTMRMARTGRIEMTDDEALLLYSLKRARD